MVKAGVPFKVLAAVGALLLTATTAANAEPEKTANIGASELKSSIKDQYGEPGEENAFSPLSKKYDGLPLELQGMRKSPLLFHQGPELIKDSVGSSDTSYNRYYPELSTSMLGALDLSVDDEITKSGIAVFTSKEAMQLSFAQNVDAVDKYLKLFTTQRGIAILTLSYLDKTVAAGLATTQQQLDQDTQISLLKQIGYSTKKIASPELWRLFDDVDEKFAYCMNPPKTGEKAVFDWEKCKLKCKPELIEMSRFHFCTCCAETLEAPNSSAVGRPGSIDPNKKPWSLVEHLMFGLKVPEQKRGMSTLVATSLYHVQEVAPVVRALYGDIITYERKDKKVVTRYAPPILSVQDWVGLFRDVEQWKKDNKTKAKWVSDECHNVAPDEENAPEAKIRYCGFNTKFIKYGVCGSLKKILDEGKSDDDPLWVEASLGGLVTAKDIRESLKYGLNEEGRARWLDAFCDAASANAFKRLHLRISSIILDHVALNRAATAHEKEEMAKLIARVQSTLTMTLQDADGWTDPLIQGVNIQGDRSNAAQASAVSNAAGRATAAAAERGSISTKGGFSD